MHMADALLSPVVALAADAVGVAAVGISVARVKKDEFSEKKVPLIGVAGALVFAGQMINFTIPGTGSSGHIGGGILLAGLLGGVPAFLSMTAVLIIQCLFFADGGLLALGCNIFNLGVIPCLLVYPLVFKPIFRTAVSYRRLSAASVISATAALVLGASCVVLQVMLSGVAQLPVGTFTALMLPIHLVIGIVEGIVTAAVLCFVHRARPEVVTASLAGGKLDGIPVKKTVAAIAVLAVLAGGALSLLASKNPDGLEWAVEGTLEKTAAEAPGAAAVVPGAAQADEQSGHPEESSTAGALHVRAAGIRDATAVLPDYSFSYDGENAAGTSASGLIGAAITFVVAGAAGLSISLVKKRKREAAGADA
ncbi:MAG: energy-coupling factor ABC transporter permease [Oscillospiraceae bacterium]|nr:energy-coupling factor ABC transporter permease [Oscillospiraceae bacterium]